MRILGINAVFHDPAAALVVDGEIVAAAEEERFSRRKHGKSAVPFSAWEQPQQAASWCLEYAGINASELDGVAYSYQPDLVNDALAGTDSRWESLRTEYAAHAPEFLKTALPGLDPAAVRFVPHHLAHAASAGLAAPFDDSAVLTVDGRGESTSCLLGEYNDGQLSVLSTQTLPHSLGLMYEDLTDHLGFQRSSDEYKVMALASYTKPLYLTDFAELIRTDGESPFSIREIDWQRWAPRRAPDEPLTQEHARLAASVQSRLEEVLLELAERLHDHTGQRRLTMAGGVALNCVANTKIVAEGPFEDVWIQPAAGDAGTAVGGAVHLAAESGEKIRPMRGADLGREYSDVEVVKTLEDARVPYEQPADVRREAADALARNEIVAWFAGRSEFGPRALGHRSLLAHPGYAANVDRLNDVKGREQFRPVAPMVLAEYASEIFSRGPIPSPYMLFVHDVKSSWQESIPAVVHRDGTARIQTVDRNTEPALAGILDEFRSQTGIPAVINTSFNTAGRPMVDSPVDALECFASSPIDVLILGSFVVRRERTGR